jgi:pimeloyl-ACP methyl ester carboxylesterase
VQQTAPPNSRPSHTRPIATTHRVETGSGAPVVLVHGVGLDHSMWDAQVAALAPRFRVLRYDMLGHGQTAASRTSTDLDSYVRQLSGLLDDLGLARVSLVGFSLGGWVAGAFAADHAGRTQRLVLMNAAFRRDPEQQAALETRIERVARGGPGATATANLERWFTAEYRKRHPEVLEQVRARLLANGPGYMTAYRMLAGSGRDFADRVPRIRCPTLVMTGADDVGSTPGMARELAAAIPGARARILPGLRHMAPVEGSDETNEHLLAFLGETDEPGS